MMRLGNLQPFDDMGWLRHEPRGLGPQAPSCCLPDISLVPDKTAEGVNLRVYRMYLGLESGGVLNVRLCD